MALTRLDNLYSSKTGKYLYVSPDDFNATDELDNRGNSPLRPFKTIQRAFIEVARYSYLPGKDNDRFDQFSIMLMPGDHYIDNRPGLINLDDTSRQRYFDARNLINGNRQEIIDRAFAQIAIDYNESSWGVDWVVPGDPVAQEKNRYYDSYRLIQKNRTSIINTAYAVVSPNPSIPNLESKCKRDIGYFIDAISLDVSLGGGNVYTRKFLQNYFNNSGTSWLSNTLDGEQTQSIAAFNAAKNQMILAIKNELAYTDLTVTIDTAQNPCENVQQFITNLTTIVTDTITDNNLDNLPAEQLAEPNLGESKCKRDIGYIVDAVASDLLSGGNSNIIAATKSYFDKNGDPISNGLLGEESQSIIAFNAARDMMHKAVTNQLYYKDLTIASGPAIYEDGGTVIENLPSGNAATCVDVQNTITTLISIITTVLDDGNLDNLDDVVVSGSLPVFNYNRSLEEWQDNSILDLSNPDNVLYKFNASTGGAIVPRGCSLIGYDLRRTIVRPLYVPDPADGTQTRTSIFNLTGGCYIWQFTIKDGDLTENSPLYDPNDRVGKVYFQKGNNNQLAIPEYSHHKITIMEYADNDELEKYYQKIASAFALFQPTIDDGDFQVLPQENRIVGPLSDTRSIINLKIQANESPDKTTVIATTKIAHGYFKGQYIAIIDNGISDLLNGTFKVVEIDDVDPRIFTYEVETTPSALGLTNPPPEGYSISTIPQLDINCRGQAEIDSVESASPYVFNCSIRSTWGLCGMWADGAKSTGFRSMVVAQYTGVSLQKDDRAFIRYDEFTNTWNQASLTDAFATVPYHTKGDAYWKDDWKNFHIRASNDAFIQCVSVFAVGFFDHFLMESGGDMSITNSNSNFGNTSLHATGFKGFAFNQDKGGYITHIVPAKKIDTSSFNYENIKYYTLANNPTKAQSNTNKLYYGADNVYDPFEKPTVSIDGYRIGAKTNEELFVNLRTNTGTTEPYSATIEPSGFLKYTASLEILNPFGLSINNKAQDAANRIEDNKKFIQSEAYGYITAKYPDLLTNTNITITKCERDIGYFVDAVVQDLRLGGNINTIQAAEGYYVGGQLAYIEEELTESIDAYAYVKQLCISSMRNFDYVIKNCSCNSASAIVNVGDTTGLLVGMKVTEYTTNDFEYGWLKSGSTRVSNSPIPENTYIKRIVSSTEIELGTYSSYLTFGSTVNATSSKSNMVLYFEFEKTANQSDAQTNLQGKWSVYPATQDLTISKDTSSWGVDGPYPECSDIASTISGYFDNILLILNQGINAGVERIEPVIDTSSLASRATLFTINTGLGLSNPHKFETGTPVRLVPKAKQGTNPDKRLIRLPKGFSTNTVYYVIAPGRTTTPENYSDFSKYQDTFTSAASTRLMLATTKENAAAGIYIHSPEAESIDENVEIEIYQYVLDVKYDLHQYKCNFITGQTDVIRTDVNHIFDIPYSSDTVQKIFFRTLPGSSGTLPQINVGGVTQVIDTNKYYYARFITKETFAVFETAAQAIAGSPRITFTNGFGQDFYVLCDKRRSPIRYDAELVNSETTTGQWYINTKSENNNIIDRLQELGALIRDPRSKNTYFTRLIDERDKSDRIYRIRYVISGYSEGVRDPLRGFVLKAKTDETRKLLPQRILLKPVSNGSPEFATFNVTSQRPTGGTITQKLGITKSDPSYDADFTYDPYFSPKIIDSLKTQSKIAFSIQSARKVGNNLELTIFDHTITEETLKNEIFTIVKIAQPQNGTGAFYSTNGINQIYWSGNSAGNALVHGYFVAPTTPNEYYLILKNVTGSIDYSSIIDTTFYQSARDNNNAIIINNGVEVKIFAKLLAPVNSAGSINNSLSKSAKKNYLYSNKFANVFSAVPGDIITDDTDTQYKIYSVEDCVDIDDTFYIFDINEIQRRIAGQQDGIYYLTCVKGNISPYPTGTGISENFRKYRFSQPISQLYPLDYKNDPLWFQVRADGTRDENIFDPPQAICAADNFIHGLVTTNDYKNSLTKEAASDLITSNTFSRYSYITNSLNAQTGNATSGSENRLIPIFGDTDYPTENRFYVELRRPSIARSGNHTFEYLGFGPGNYSTGFPLRQEVVLSDTQDFYAQAKREDGGIVFYTGLNSNGDLYIGNRKINAITGEETFLEKAELLSSDDEGGDLGGLVSTFELPVVFEKEITVDGDATFNNPVTINVQASEPNSLTIISNIDTGAGDDPSIGTTSFEFSDILSKGEIVLDKNTVYSAVFVLNPRGNQVLPGQNYSIRTHANNTASYVPTNKTPNQENSALGFAVSYGSLAPNSGDMLLKGAEIGLSGSLGWIYSNYYTNRTSSFNTVSSNGSRTITFTLKSGTTANSIGISVNKDIKLSGFIDNFESINGIRKVYSVAQNGASFTIIAPFTISSGTNAIASGSQINAKVEISTVKWKEFGVLGSEALRTYTEDNGDYRLGINTVARADHSDNNTAFVSENTKPRANLDVVGTAFISGKILSIGEENEFNSNSSASARTFNATNNAFLVGGNSASPDEQSVFRISTTNNGRVGINVTNSQLNGTANSGVYNKAFAVNGEGYFSNNLRTDGSLAVNGSTISSTSTIFNITNNNVLSAFAFGRATTIKFGHELNTIDTLQEIFIGSQAYKNNTYISTTSTETVFNVHTNSLKSRVSIATTPDDYETNLNYSVIQIGGAFSRDSTDLLTGSVFGIKNRYTEVDGNLTIGKNTNLQKVFLQAGTNELDLFTLKTSRINFASSTSRLYIGARGGESTINNSLKVLASTILEGDTTINGGLNTGQFQVFRGSYNVSPLEHSRGSIDNNNIDFYERIDFISNIQLKIDTAGLQVWGGTTFRPDPTKVDEYHLPLSNVATGELELGQFILIDRSIAVDGQNTSVSPVGEQYSELLEVIGLTNLNDVNNTIRVLVRRARNVLNSDGTMVTSEVSPSGYKYLRTDHPDNCKLVKYNLTRNASYINNTNGLSSGTNDNVVSTGIFSGDVGTGDLFRLSPNSNGYGGELVRIVTVNQTSSQKLSINDGGSPNVETFSVESTTGNTFILGTLEVNKSITFKGSNTEDAEFFVIKNQSNVDKFYIDSSSGSTKISGNLSIGSTNFDKFIVNSSTGNLSIKGGNLTITDNSLVQKLFLQNSTGNLTISGNITSSTTSGDNLFNANMIVNGGNLTVNKIVDNEEEKLFKVNSNGSIDLGGTDVFYSSTGGRKWIYISSGLEIVDAEVNTNYFVSPSSNLTIKLPSNPRTGDMIRIIDVGGNLTYNISLKIRGYSGHNVQGDSQNSGTPVITDWNGGELVVQTPNAGFGLVYLGDTYPDSNNQTGAPASQKGWWLMEI